MSEENKFNAEGIKETAEEVKETIGEAVEKAQDAIEEVKETVNDFKENAGENIGETVEAVKDAAANIGETVSDVKDATEETFEGVKENFGEAFEQAGEAFEDAKEAAKSNKLPVIIAAIVAVLVIAAIAALFLTGTFGKMFNKYNRGYVNTTGRTIEQVAEESGMTFDEFLAEYGLPKNMPKNTYESAAFYAMSVGKVAELYGMDFAALKETLKLGDEVSENDTWGKVEGEVALGTYLGGEENLAEFKEYYGLGDDVNADTKWKEVRLIVDTKTKEDREKSEAALNDPQNQATDEDSADLENVQDSAPAEEAADGEDLPEDVQAAIEDSAK